MLGDILKFFSQVTDVSGALSGIGGVFGGIFSAMTDVTMWRSLGWLFLGVLLMWWGILLWAKVPQKAAELGTKVAKVL